jgi:hypothetical protein
MAQALGRVVDSSALDTCGRSRGRHTIEVPQAWIGAEILVAIPSRVVCARCDGGGCDGCGRRGGHRIEGDASARSLRVRLPRAIDSVVVLRIARPFGDADGAIAQLHLETRIGSGASAGVVLCVLAPAETPHPLTQPHRSKGFRHVAWVIAVIAAAGIITYLSTMR